MPATKEALKEAVIKASRDGRMTCEKAHELGKEHDVPLQAIGAVCNELNIKITACQLGCF
ncbi:MAG: hypothetical protein H6R44_299 [Nitrospirae bacterium]|jgi:hypothetical protein|nr:hypothetical protein [Nitrospirota bacterium]